MTAIHNITNAQPQHCCAGAKPTITPTDQKVKKAINWEAIGHTFSKWVSIIAISTAVIAINAGCLAAIPAYMSGLFKMQVGMTLLTNLVAMGILAGAWLSKRNPAQQQ